MDIAEGSEVSAGEQRNPPTDADATDQDAVEVSTPTGPGIDSLYAPVHPVSVDDAICYPRPHS